jgi:glycosyltransferase involved in cell wall biosynthesis
VRILYLADIRFPLERANGIQTFETCYALADRGHEITLAVRPDTNRPVRDPFAFYGRERQPRLRIERRGVWPGPMKRVGYIARAMRLAMTGRFDAVMTRDLGIAAMLLRLPRGMRPPLVYESHGYAPAVSAAMPQLLAGGRRPPSRAKLARLAAREASVWQHAEGYVTITRALAAELTDRFGGRSQLMVVPDGVRLSATRSFAPAPDTSAPVVAYAGHLYPWKGVDVLLEALARLPRVKGLIIGGHPAESDIARLQHRAAHLCIAERVQFTGMVEPAAVPGLLAKAHVLVLPNIATRISERYTSPLKLFEYLAAGRPIVASDLPALREVVTADVDAVLVTPGDPRALADGIARVLGDSGLAHSLSSRAWSRAEAFSWAARAERIEQMIQAVTGSSTGRGAESDA